MRKALLLALALALAIISGCYKEDTEEAYAHGLDLIELMDEIAESEICKEVFSADEKSMDLIKQAGAGDYTSPVAIYEIKLSSRTLEALTSYRADGSLSTNLQNYLNDKATLAVANYINAGGGTSAIAAASLCSVQTSFYCEDVTSDTIYLYLFENGFPVIVSFITCEKSAVYASGSFIMNSGFDASSESALSQYLSKLDASLIKIK